MLFEIFVSFSLFLFYSLLLVFSLLNCTVTYIEFNASIFDGLSGFNTQHINKFIFSFFEFISELQQNFFSLEVWHGLQNKHWSDVCDSLWIRKIWECFVWFYPHECDSFGCVSYSFFNDTTRCTTYFCSNLKLRSYLLIKNTNLVDINCSCKETCVVYLSMTFKVREGLRTALRPK